jgi:ATP-binding cassette subfamily B protein/subfamily B ATP-binding cassette protein MsbA
MTTLRMGGESPQRGKGPGLDWLWRGGVDRHAVALLQGICRRHWRLLAATTAANLVAVLFESSTIGILLLALRTLAAPGDAVAEVPLLQPVFDRLAPGVGQTGMFLALIVLAVLTQILVSLFAFASRWLVARLQARVEGRLRARVFRQFMTMSFPQVRQYKVGDLASYNDQINYVGHVIQLLNLLVSQALMAAAYLALLTLLSWPMTLVAVIGGALLSLLFARVLRRIRAHGRRFTRAGVALNARTVEFLSALRLVRTFGREAYATDKAEEAIREGVEHRRRALVWHATISPATDAITTLGVALFLVGGYLLVYDGQTEALPRLVTFLVVLYRLLPRVKFVNDRLGHVSSYWEFVRRVAAILRTDDKQYVRRGGDVVSGLKRGIEFENVSLRYVEGEGRALHDVSFAMPRGSLVALVGESGAGKSSLADLLIGLYEPTEGRLLVDGRELAELDWLSWRDQLAMVSQESFILNATVRENILFGRLSASDEEVKAAARVAGANELIGGVRHGLDTLLGEHGFRLSAGQRQRLAIARAVLREPDLLILDEATSHLDSRSERQIQQALARLRADRTVLVIAHRLSTVVSADRILVLEKGRLVEEGSHAELLALDGLYPRFWRLQLQRAPGDDESLERDPDVAELKP